MRCAAQAVPCAPPCLLVLASKATRRISCPGLASSLSTPPLRRPLAPHGSSPRNFVMPGPVRDHLDHQTTRRAIILTSRPPQHCAVLLMRSPVLIRAACYDHDSISTLMVQHPHGACAFMATCTHPHGAKGQACHDHEVTSIALISTQTGHPLGASVFRATCKHPHGATWPACYDHDRINTLTVRQPHGACAFLVTCSHPQGQTDKRVTIMK